MTYLLDVDVLVALLWQPHTHHDAAHAWLESHSETWATTAYTEAAFVRVVCNPKISHGAVTPARALTALEFSLASPRYDFLSSDLNFTRAVRSVCRQPKTMKDTITAYLIGVADGFFGKLATFDPAAPSLVADPAKAAELVQVIPGPIASEP